MYYLGVDLGGTNIKAALVDADGAIIKEASTPTKLPRPAEAVCDDIAALCNQLAQGQLVAGIGVGCPGTVDGGLVRYSNNLDWHDFAMGDYLRAKTGLPVALANDANAAALGEALAGCAKGAESAVIITLGTGVGGGVVLGGKLLTGYTGAAVEPGHMVILDTPDAPRCTCGRPGCLESLASATALIRMTKEAMAAHPESALHGIAAQSGGVNGRTAFDAAAQGDVAGKLLTGYTGAAAEPGHMVILDTPDAPRCTCGRPGCLESLASATALIRMTKEAMAAHPESALHGIAAQSGGVNGRTAFDAAAQGDAAGKAVVEQYIHYLAVGVANMINIFFPEVIGLSGGVANQGENLLAPLRAAVGPMVFGNAYAQKHTRITTCTLGYRAGVIGAALLAKNQG